MPIYDGSVFTSLPDGSVTLKPHLLRALRCASGQHESDGPPFFVSEGSDEPIPLGWPKKKRFLACKHCHCLYQDE